MADITSLKWQLEYKQSAFTQLRDRCAKEAEEIATMQSELNCMLELSQDAEKIKGQILELEKLIAQDPKPFSYDDLKHIKCSLYWDGDDGGSAGVTINFTDHEFLKSKFPSFAEASDFNNINWDVDSVSWDCEPEEFTIDDILDGLNSNAIWSLDRMLENRKQLLILLEAKNG